MLLRYLLMLTIAGILGRRSFCLVFVLVRVCEEILM